MLNLAVKLGTIGGGLKRRETWCSFFHWFPSRHQTAEDFLNDNTRLILQVLCNPSLATSHSKPTHNAWAQANAWFNNWAEQLVWSMLMLPNEHLSPAACHGTSGSRSASWSQSVGNVSARSFQCQVIQVVGVQLEGLLTARIQRKGARRGAQRRVGTKPCCWSQSLPPQAASTRYRFCVNCTGEKTWQPAASKRGSK